MAEPSQKTDEIEDLIQSVFGVDRRECIQQNVCTWCGSQVKEFSDSLSRKEYMISGMCQECQDRAFAEPDDDEPFEDL